MMRAAASQVPWLGVVRPGPAIPVLVFPLGLHARETRCKRGQGLLAASASERGRINDRNHTFLPRRRRPRGIAVTLPQGFGVLVVKKADRIFSR